MNWRTSSYSTNGTSCVAIATPDLTTVHVRNSNHPERGSLALSTSAVATFVTACQAGELDDLA